MSNRNVANVLVVDDEPELRELLIDALSCPGVRVNAAGSGKEAVELARRNRPDILVTDLRLGDCTGLDIIDHLRRSAGEIPAVVITGYGDPVALTEASRRRPVELMIKPLDVRRLQSTINRELTKLAGNERLRRRTRRLRRLAKESNIECKNARRQLRTTCVDLAGAYRALSGQMAGHQVMLDYQRSLIQARNDDDVFRTLFRAFVRQSGPVFGIAMACDQNAELRVVGRFGVPYPDNPRFCDALARPLVDIALVTPQCMVMDAGEQAEMFDESIRRYLVGVSVLTMPLLPADGQMIGLVSLYRKGEQPFTDADLALARLLAGPTALAVQRND